MRKKLPQFIFFLKLGKSESRLEEVDIRVLEAGFGQGGVWVYELNQRKGKGEFFGLSGTY